MLVPLGSALGVAILLLAVDTVLRRRTASDPSSATRFVSAARALALVLLAGGLVRGSVLRESFGEDLKWLLVFGATGLLLFEVAGRLGITALPGLAASIAAGNPAAGIAAAGHLAATGVLLGGTFGGTSFEDLAVATVFFVVGQAALLGLLWLFRRLTSYDDREEILGGNLAAALSHAGLAVALGLLIVHAQDGPYLGPRPALQAFAIALGEGLLVYPVRQVVIAGLILRRRPSLLGGEVDRAIAEDRDVGIGALEAATYLGVALLVRSLG